MIYLRVGTKKQEDEKEGFIFNIQKFSLHDGPGIRTIVFFKECSLKCEWCSNPESQRKKQDISFESDKCMHCGRCTAFCPSGAIRDRSITEKHIDRNKCICCGTCEEVCIADAIQLIGRYVSVDEVMTEVLKDRLFYEESGGGLTLSGGEPLLQPLFAKKLLERAKEEGIHTVIETAGNVFWKNFEDVIEFTDLFLYDIKTMDDDKHIKMTKSSNKRILENACKLAAITNVIIRTPVIPEVNDTEKDIKQIALFAKKLGVKDMELLPYHRLGESKFDKLGRNYSLHGTSVPDDEYMERLKDIVRNIVK